VVKPGHNPTSDWRRQFASVADAERGSVEVVHVLNGGLLDRGVLFRLRTECKILRESKVQGRPCQLPCICLRV